MTTLFPVIIADIVGAQSNGESRILKGKWVSNYKPRKLGWYIYASGSGNVDSLGREYRPIVSMPLDNTFLFYPEPRGEEYI